jgi:DNA-binding transcriptional ArsR family regulator
MDDPLQTRKPVDVPDKDGGVVLDAALLRGLTHPVRMRILGLLRAEGPSTATELARRLGLNSGATSYHLRQLALYRFIEEDPQRGNARERWWRAAHRSTWFDRSSLEPESQPLGEAYLRIVAAAYAERTQQAIDELPTLPAAWREAGTISDFCLRLTPAETEHMLAEIATVIGRYRRDDPEHPEDAPAETAPVVLQIQAFPRPGSVEGEQPS